MPSARDLLQQADTLMRSNRSVGAADPDEAVPLLTDVAVPGGSGISHSQRRDEIPVLTNAVTSFPETAFEVSAGDDSLPRFPATEPPSGDLSQSEVRARFSAAETLRDSTIFPISQMPRPTVPGADEPARHANLEPARDTEPVFSVTAMRAQLEEAEDWEEMIAPAPDPEVVSGPGPAAAVAAEPAPPAVAVAESAPSAAEIAETVYYQVLQNLDLYTERALQEHLTTHLAPILERASNELLATLHANLGGLIRQYVAEAIEKQLGVRPEAGK